MSKYTFGGMPAAEAWIWEDRTYKMLGEILMKLCSGDSNKRKQGQVEYYHMKRHFMRDVFEAYVDKLDNFRTSKGVTTMSELVLIASKEWVTMNPANIAPVPSIMPALNSTSEVEAFRERMKINIKSEQLSLF